ncbi:uncharacterized protein LOC143470021 [Clavelina lepadiformis]|uniref:uncharacterized protein LOC143470021 n=1 Tax=Clavelina lepadiformis TaxID=159417 RepID=UPI004041AA24
MRGQFKYLQTVRKKKKSGLMCCTTLTVHLAIAGMCGVIIGFNVRDVILRACVKIELKSLTSSGSINTRDWLPVEKASNKIAVKKPKLVFKTLPQKYLWNQTAHKPAVVFPLKPWKYLEGTKSSRYFMTFLVKTAAPLVGRRFLVRQTWGSILAINGDRFGIIFLIGMVSNSEQERILNEENVLYGDILQSDVMDDYNNLPVKVLGSLQWLTYNVGDVSDFFTTTDDDCVINIPVVYDYFRRQTEAMKKFMHCGYIYDRGHSPIRKQNFKWGVSEEIYSGDVYPTFCHGGMIVSSYDVWSKIYQTSEKTNYTGMHLEDVLISGILRQKAFNTSGNIVSRAHFGLPDNERHFMWHLGTTRNLQLSFRKAWFKTRGGIRLGPDDKLTEKAESAFRLNATLDKIALLPGKQLNETIKHFVTFWAQYVPYKRPIPESRKNEQNIQNLHKKEKNDFKQFKEIETEEPSRPVGETDIPVELNDKVDVI